HPRAGSRKLCHCRNGAVLGSSPVYRDRRPLGSWGRELSITVPEAARTPVCTGLHGAAGGRGFFAILPFRRCAENDFEWRRGGLSALCAFQGNRRFEQGRAHASNGSSLAAGLCRGANGARGVVVPGGRVMAAS